MNVQDIVTRVRRTFGDEAAVQVTDADVIRWINDAQIEIVKNNDQALQKSTTLDLVANQATYSLPADLLLLRSLRYKFTDMQSYQALIYKSVQQFDETMDGWDGSLYSATNPVYFTMFEEKLTLFPTPDQAATGGLKLLYNQKPTDVTTVVDNLALPLIYHNTVVRYAMWQASLLDEDLDPVQLYRDDFEKDINNLKNNENQDPTAKYAVITIRDEDM